MNFKDGVPQTAGVYAVNGYKDEMRRAWSPKTGWSCCWYDGDPSDIVARAMLADADRENVGSIRWAECTAP